MTAASDDSAALPVAAPPPRGDATLVPLLRGDMVSWEVLQRRYGSLLKLVRILLGVVPNCDRYLEIWPPAFRTYNVMVPNFLNLPVPIFGVGGAPGDVVGLGMYVASGVAECPYCTAHSMLHRLSAFYADEPRATSSRRIARVLSSAWR